MLRHIHDLSDENEYFFLWMGQSTSRPFGKRTEAYELFPNLEEKAIGLDITVALPASYNAVDTLTTTTDLEPGEPGLQSTWVGAQLRLGTPEKPLVGYGIVQRNTDNTLTVDWEVVPTRTSATVDAYLVWEDARNSKYGHLRVLTPYQPTTDDSNSRTVPYPPASGGWGAGEVPRKTPGYPNAAASTFEHHALLLDFTWNEGINGHGISEVTKNVGLFSVSGLVLSYGQSPVPCGVNTAADTLTLVSHGFVDNDTFVLSGTAAPGGLSFGVTYYVRTIGSPNAFSVAAYPDGPAIDITTAGTSVEIAKVPNTPADLMIGGYVVCDWTDGSGESKRSWGRIADNTPTSITVDAWGGDGQPSSATAPPLVTAWIPHWLDSPHAYTAFTGFTYPSNDMHPYSDKAHTAMVNGAVIRNRPRGHPNKNYRDLFGAIFLFGMRLSQALGKRVNIVHLGLNGSALFPTLSRNPRGFPGTVGWYDQHQHLGWSPASGGRIWSRVETLLRHCLPNAMAAEGNTKAPKFLGFYLSQGEGDALNQQARFYYAESLGQLKREVRNLLRELDYDPYVGTGAEVPFVQPQIMVLPYALKGTYDYYGSSLTFNGDVQGFVNDAIVRQAEEDEFSDWFPRDDLPRNLNGADGPDLGHLNGVGECIEALRTSFAMVKVVDRALSYGSPALVSTSRARAHVSIANEALALIGESAINSFEDGSSNATICQRLYRQAVDSVLQMRQWSFALRRKAIAEVRMPEQTLYGQYKHCYVVPAEATRPFEVLPPDKIREPFELGLVTQFTVVTPSPLLLENIYSDQVVANFTDKIGDNRNLIGDYLPPSELPTVSRSDLQPIPFQVERSPTGGTLLFCDQEQVTMRFVDRLIDPLEFPSTFRQVVIHHLASMLAPAIVRGREGDAMSQQQLLKAQAYLMIASDHDGVAHKPDHGPFDFIPDHIANR